MVQTGDGTGETDATPGMTIKDLLAAHSVDIADSCVTLKHILSFQFGTDKNH